MFQRDIADHFTNETNATAVPMITHVSYASGENIGHPIVEVTTPQDAVKTRLFVTQLNQPSPSQQLPTPVRVQQLKYHLKGYDENEVKYLITDGFQVDFSGEEITYCSKNSRSTAIFENKTQEKITNAVALG